MPRMRKPTGLKRDKSRELELKHILVVCEGKTGHSEPCYLAGLRKLLRISDTQMTIVGSEKCGSAPVSIVNYAKAQLRRADKEKKSYSKVFCVFDTEFDPQHESLSAAIEIIRSNERLDGIISNPRFEYWLLLHFERKVFTLQNRGELNKFMNKYQELRQYNENKKMDNIEIFNEKIAIAVENCKKLGFSEFSLQEIKSSSHSVTNFHFLYNSYVKSLKKSRLAFFELNFCYFGCGQVYFYCCVVSLGIGSGVYQYG